VKLSLDLPEPDVADPRAPRYVLAGVDDTAVEFEAGAPPAHVLQIRYRADGVEDPPVIHLVQVLRPLAGRAFCALGAELSRRDDPSRKLLSYALTFVPLLASKTKVVQLEQTRVEARDSETRREYWTARGFKLAKIFDEATGHMQSAESGGTTTTVGTIKLSGDFPRRIDLTAVTKRGGCEVRAGDNTPCDDGGPVTTTTFVYDGTKYVRKK